MFSNTTLIGTVLMEKCLDMALRRAAQRHGLTIVKVSRNSVAGLDGYLMLDRSLAVVLGGDPHVFSATYADCWKHLDALSEVAA